MYCTHSYALTVVVCGIANAVDGSEDGLINVLKEGGVLADEYDDIIHQLSSAKGGDVEDGESEAKLIVENDSSDTADVV